MAAPSLMKEARALTCHGTTQKDPPEDSIFLPHDLNEQKHQTSRNKARGEVGLNMTGRGNLVGASGIVGFCLLLGALCLLERAGGLSPVVESDIQSLLEDHND